jgi:hypothetical protein
MGALFCRRFTGGQMKSSGRFAAATIAAQLRGAAGETQ